MIILIPVVYLAIGFVYAMNVFGKAPHSRPLGATENPTGFFFMALLLWPIPMMMNQSMNTRIRGQLPQSVRNVTRHNVVAFLGQHPPTSLSPEELRWCERCLHDILDHNYVSPELSAAAMRKGAELAQYDRQKQALNLLDAVDAERKRRE